MNAYLIPTYSDENEYLQNITKGLEYNGVKVLSSKCKNKKIAPLESIMYAATKKDYVVHFNWIENKVNAKGVKAYINYVVIWLWILVLKIFNAKIVWTMHNKMPHDSQNEKLVKSFYGYFTKSCDLIMVHCKESETILKEECNYNGHILNVPHGNYCNEGDTEDTLFGRMKEMSFLYFGAVSKYKNILILIDAYERVAKNNPNIKLRICGKCRDESLDAEIKRRIERGAGIVYENRFLSEEELESEIEKSCAILLPYDKVSMLNSGSAIMALSKGRSIIIPEFGYLSDIKDKEFVFVYDYKDNIDHITNLSETWNRAIMQQENENTTWEKLGRKAFRFAHEELDWKCICKSIVENYAKL